MGGIEKKKVWTSIVIIPPVLLLIVFGPPFVFSLMVLAASFLGLHEFYRLTLPQAKWIERWVGISLGMILTVFLACGGSVGVAPFFVATLLILCLLVMATAQDLSSAVASLGIMLLGVLYIGFLLGHLSLIWNLSAGKTWTLFLIVSVWAGDISALLIGSLFGRHKLYPKISPKKTVEGLFGAIFGSVVISLAFAALFLPHMGKGFCALLAIGLGVLGQVGDFSESLLKRSAQVKDSGSLFPGHGGMLDRLDSFLFSAPFLYYILLYGVRVTP